MPDMRAYRIDQEYGFVPTRPAPHRPGSACMWRMADNRYMIGCDRNSWMNGLPVFCPACGGTVFLLKENPTRLATSAHPPTFLVAWKAKNGLDYTQAAAATGVSVDQWNAYEAGEDVPPHVVVSCMLYDLEHAE